jgi:hypothetical protein
MINTIDVLVEFSFQGETHSPTITLDLDVLVHTNTTDDFYSLHRTIAQKNNIDTYSYLYDAMECHPIVFLNARGLADNFFQDKVFDFAGFQKEVIENRIVEQVSQVAKSVMGIEDIDSQPKLKQAMLEIYQLGAETQLQAVTRQGVVEDF